MVMSAKAPMAAVALGFAIVILSFFDLVVLIGPVGPLVIGGGLALVGAFVGAVTVGKQAAMEPGTRRAQSLGLRLASATTISVAVFGGFLGGSPTYTPLDGVSTGQVLVARETSFFRSGEVTILRVHGPLGLPAGKLATNEGYRPISKGAYEVEEVSGALQVRFLTDSRGQRYEGLIEVR